MYLRMEDRKALFATHFIRAAIPDVAREDIPLQVEPDGIVCCHPDELEQGKAQLDKLNIPYTIEALPEPTTLNDKAKGIKYASRTEALEHLVNDKEPASQVMPNLLKRVEKAEKENKELKNKFEALEAKVNKGGG